MKRRKNPSTQQIIQQLSNGELCLSPLRFELIAVEPVIRDLTQQFIQADARIKVYWGDLSAVFVVEIKTRYIPSVLMQAKEQIRRIAKKNKSLPMIIVPYLSPDRIDELASEEMSAIDLCGNGVVVIPKKIFVLRTGMPNMFIETVIQNNVYRGLQSIVCRALLTRPYVNSLNDLLININELGGSLSLPSVSKVVTTLTEELIVTKERRRIQLIQPDLLLDRLSENYVKPEENRRIKVKSSLNIIDLQRKITEKAGERSIRVTATGTSSAERYAVMAQSGPLSVYCENITELLKDIPYEEAPWFPNLELIETSNQSVYLDARQDASFIWASPVQTYLELMNEDARAQSIAFNVRQYILEEIAKWK